MGQLRVAVAGGTGRTGKEIVRYLNAEEGITVVGVVARTLAGKSMSVVLPDLGRDIPIFGDFAELCAVHPPPHSRGFHHTAGGKAALLSVPGAAHSSHHRHNGISG